MNAPAAVSTLAVFTTASLPAACTGCSVIAWPASAATVAVVDADVPLTTTSTLAQAPSPQTVPAAPMRITITPFTGATASGPNWRGRDP